MITITVFERALCALHSPIKCYKKPNFTLTGNRFLEEYQQQGLKVWSLSGGNEGMLIMFLMALESSPLNSTLLFSPIQRTWFKNYLKPYLVSSNFSDVKILALEDQRMFAPYWMERVSVNNIDKESRYQPILKFLEQLYYRYI